MVFNHANASEMHTYCIIVFQVKQYSARHWDLQGCQWCAAVYGSHSLFPQDEVTHTVELMCVSTYVRSSQHPRIGPGVVV